MGNETSSNPFTLENFVKITAFSAAAIYGALFIGYRRYFAELHISPEDVGIGSAFVLVRSIGFIVLGVGAVLLVAAIVGDLYMLRTEGIKPKESNPEKMWLRRLRRWVWRWRWLLLLPVLVALLMWYLYLLRPPYWPLLGVFGTGVVLLIVAAVVSLVDQKYRNGVGLLISVLIAMVLPTLFITARAHAMADVALKSDVVTGGVVEPFSILGIPVLDVSTEKVDVQWICNQKDAPYVFHGKPTSAALLLGETSSSLFVRIDPPNTAPPIVKLPAECAVAIRHEPSGAG
jgi:hypothetical protein